MGFDSHLLKCSQQVNRKYAGTKYSVAAVGSVPGELLNGEELINTALVLRDNDSICDPREMAKMSLGVNLDPPIPPPFLNWFEI